MCRGQTLVAEPNAGMAAVAAPGRTAAGLHGADRKRPRHRYGDVRERLPAGPEYVRPGPVRESRRDVARGRPRLLRTERSAPVSGVLRLPPAGAGLQAQCGPVLEAARVD